MLTSIKDDIDKELYIGRMTEIDKFFARQSRLPKEARVQKQLIMKLEQLYQFLAKEVTLYDTITNIG